MPVVCSKPTRLAAMAFVLIIGFIELSCGDTYRPVAQVIPLPTPNPAAFHYVISLSTNGNNFLQGGTCAPSGTPPPCVADPGAASRIDVSGDTTVGVLRTGVMPTHGALLPNGGRLYVVNSAEDTVYVNNTTSPTVAAAVVNLPSGARPVFVHTTENGNVYVANSGNNTVSVINTSSNVVTATVPVGTNPVALAEMPVSAGASQKVYVANQGSGDVTVINVIDDSVQTTIPVGAAPTWAVARADGARIYVLDNNGTIYDIDTLSDTVRGTVSSGGTGAKFIEYNSRTNTLVVTNSSSGSVSVLDAASDPPTLRPNSPIAIAAAAGSGCAAAAVPTSITVLPDGRAYVASYQADPANVCTQLSVVDSAAGVVTKTIPLTQAVNDASDTGCNTARFRTFAASSGGGSTTNFKVYVAQCDQGSVAVVNTFTDSSGPADTFKGIALPAPLSSFTPVGQPPIPPYQNPVFVIAGP